MNSQDLLSILKYMPQVTTQILAFDNGVANHVRRAHIRPPSRVGDAYQLILDTDPTEREGYVSLPDLITLKEIEEEFGIPKSTVRNSKLPRFKLAQGIPLLFDRRDVRQYAIEREKRLYRRAANAKTNTTSG